MTGVGHSVGGMDRRLCLGGDSRQCEQCKDFFSVISGRVGRRAGILGQCSARGQVACIDGTQRSSQGRVGQGGGLCSSSGGLGSNHVGLKFAKTGQGVVFSCLRGEDESLSDSGACRIVLAIEEVCLSGPGRVP